MWKRVVTLAVVGLLFEVTVADETTCLPPLKCKENEVYDPCPPKCPFQTCGINDDLIDCMPQPRPGDKNCSAPACRCKNRYYRDDKGKCVIWKNCPKCTGPNEKYDPCDAPCPERTCVFDLAATLCMVAPQLGDKECVAGCRCEDGFLRNDKGVCIPQDQCPPRCPPNERYEECPATICSPKTCAEAGFPLPCPIRKEGEPCPGKPGCICNDGYLRDCNGVCIPSQDCPSCGGDKNSTLGCGINCGRLCSNYDSKEPIACILLCRINSCDCRPDFVYDTNVDKCVLPCDCTPVCKANEIYSTCANAACKQRCEDQNKSDVCPRPKRCVDGCVCAKGYLRDSKGNCIPISKCPKC